MGVLGTILKVATLPIKWVAGLISDAVKANKENKKQEEALRTKEALDNIRDTNDKKGTEAISNQNEKIKASRRKLAEAQREYESAQKSIQTQKAQLTREINAENTDEYMNEAKIAFSSNSDSEGSPQESYKSLGEGTNSTQNSSRGFRGIFRSYYGYDPEGNRVKLHGKLRAEARRKANLDAKKQRNLEKLEKLKQKEFEIENRKSFATFGLLGRIQENQYYRNQLAQAKLETDDKVRNASIKALKKQHREEKAARRRKLAGLLALGITPFLLSSTLRNGLKEFTETNSVGKFLKNIWDGFTGTIKNAWEWFSTNTTIGKAIRERVDAIKVKLGWDTNKSVLANLWSGATSWIDNTIVPAIKNAALKRDYLTEEDKLVINSSNDLFGTLFNTFAVTLSNRVRKWATKAFGDKYNELASYLGINSSYGIDKTTGKSTWAFGDAIRDLVVYGVSRLLGIDDIDDALVAGISDETGIGGALGILINKTILKSLIGKMSPELQRAMGIDESTGFFDGIFDILKYFFSKLLGVTDESDLNKYGLVKDSGLGRWLGAVLSKLWEDVLKPILLPGLFNIANAILSALDLGEATLGVSEDTIRMWKGMSNEMLDKLLSSGTLSTEESLVLSRIKESNKQAYATIPALPSPASTVKLSSDLELDAANAYTRLFNALNANLEKGLGYVNLTNLNKYLNSLDQNGKLGYKGIVDAGANYEALDVLRILSKIKNPVHRFLAFMYAMADVYEKIRPSKRNEAVNTTKGEVIKSLSELSNVYQGTDYSDAFNSLLSYYASVPDNDTDFFMRNNPFYLTLLDFILKSQQHPSASGKVTNWSDSEFVATLLGTKPDEGSLNVLKALGSAAVMPEYTEPEGEVHYLEPETVQATYDINPFKYIEEKSITNFDIPKTGIKSDTSTERNNLLIGQPMLLPAVNTVTEKDRFVFTFKQTNDYAVGN